MADLNDLTNSVLFALLEPGANIGGVPSIPANATFTQPVITDAINKGILAFTVFTESAPSLTEKLFQATIVAGLDYALPADCVSLTRVEYDAGNTGNPIPLNACSFDQFDNVTGDNASLTATGAPRSYREPYNGKIRLNPQPNAANVAANDQIYLYYRSYGTMLALGTDIPNIPYEFHEVPVLYAVARLLPRKYDQADGVIWMKQFEQWCKLAKGRIWNLNQDREFQIQDAEMSGIKTLYDD